MKTFNYHKAQQILAVIVFAFPVVEELRGSKRPA